MPEGKLGKMWFSGTFCNGEETVCIAVSIHLSEYLKVCALGAKGKMNNGQAWIPKGGGQSRQTSARLREGLTPGPRPAASYSVSDAHQMWFTSPSFVHYFPTLGSGTGFWAPTLTGKLMHTLLRWDKFEIAFKIRRLGVNEHGVLSLKRVFVLNSKCHICFLINRRYLKHKLYLPETIIF